MMEGSILLECHRLKSRPASELLGRVSRAIAASTAKKVPNPHPKMPLPISTTQKGGVVNMTRQVNVNIIKE
jgi:hypothetical protein